MCLFVPTLTKLVTLLPQEEKPIQYRQMQPQSQPLSLSYALASTNFTTAEKNDDSN